MRPSVDKKTFFSSHAQHLSNPNKNGQLIHKEYRYSPE